MRRIALFLLLVLTVSCKEKVATVTSSYLKEQITIDGDAEEWTQSLRFNDDGSFGYAVANDAQFLYLCIKADKQLFQQAMRGGLTVWFDSTAQARKILGIRYPKGMQRRDPETSDRQEWGEKPSLDERHLAIFGEMEILGPEKDDKNRAPAQNNFGIQAAIGGLPDDPVYELKIPLLSEKGHPYAVSAPAGAEISIGIESGKFAGTARETRSDGGRGGRGGMGPGGMGPDGGSGGMGPDGSGFEGSGGRGRGERSPANMDGGQSASKAPIKIWLRVQLAN